MALVVCQFMLLLIFLKLPFCRMFTRHKGFEAIRPGFSSQGNFFEMQSIVVIIQDKGNFVTNCETHLCFSVKKLYVIWDTFVELF